MLRNSEVKDQYDQVIEEYLTIGHMSRKEHYSVYSPKPSNYLTRHAVLKPDSTTTKLRGISLNNALHTGLLTVPHI